MPIALFAAGAARAQDLQPRPVALPPAPAAGEAPANDDQVRFSAGTLEYDTNTQVVTATGDVRMIRDGERLRADRVEWNRTTGRVVATGSIATTNSAGDVAYGDRIELTDTLKDGVVDNLLIVLERGGRLAAEHGTRAPDETVTMDRAAYTACPVTTGDGCPREPSWKITAVRIIYRPERQRIYYHGARIQVFGLGLPVPDFSNPVGGGGNDTGLLTPDLRYSRVNGVALAVPYHFGLAPNRGLTITPHLFTAVLPMLQANYQQLIGRGAFSITGYGTVSRKSDDLNVLAPTTGEQAFRGYLDGIGRYQFSPSWSAGASVRLVTDRTFLRRYDISYDDRLRTTLNVSRVDRDSYLSITGWYVQSLRLFDQSGQQPIALPEIDYRRRFEGLFGGVLQLQANSLAITRTEGQDSQRAFAAAQWDLRRITPFGQVVTLTGYLRGDLYHTDDSAATLVPTYRGEDGVHARGIAALALDVQWPFVGAFLGGTQRVTPRFQIVAAPHIANMEVPNEDARAVDLEDSNLFALNRFSGYDRFEDSTRFTYGLNYALDLRGLSINADIGQSYRLTSRQELFPDGTGLSDRTSDIVGRTEVRFRDFVSLTYRYRLDKDNFAIRRNEVDATVGSRSTYLLIGYLRLNRNIDPTLEDLQDREEARVGGRVQVARFWSVFGSATVDLTDRQEDPLSISDGFDPIRHRLGFQYEDDCLRLGLAWRHDYATTGDARSGNSFLLTLAFKNLGR